MDFTLTSDEQQLVSLASLLADREIRPNAQKAWDEGRCAIEVLRAMGDAGLLGLLVPEEWGGTGMSTVALVAAMEEIGAADQSIAAAWQAHLTIGSIPLLMFGSDEQKERWLRPVAEGRVLAAFGLTEPDAGSDASSIKTRASRVDGGWLINGSKTFISNAGTDMSYGLVVLARTGERSNGRPSFGNFIIETGTEGYTWGNKLQGIGWRGLDTRQLYFADVFVPDDQVLGEVGTGLGQFLSTLEVGRISVAALANSLSKAVLAMAIDYANERTQFGAKIGSYQGIQFKLADVATELEASRWLTYRAAQLRDSGAPFRTEAAMAKLQASRVAVRAASEAVQVFGGLGYMMETPVARFYCDAKVLEIGEGTSEIQQMVIARDIGVGVR